MNKNLWQQAGLAALCLTVFTLPWQTKLILRAASSNYWEISIFAAFVFLYLSLFLLLPSGLLSLNFWKETPLKIKIVSFIFLLSALISVFISSDYLLAGFRFLLLLSAFVFYYILKQLSPFWRRRLLIIFLISLGLQALIGITQFLTQTSLASTYLGMAYHGAGDLGAIVIETVSGRWLRAYGASDHPNIFGGLMVLASLISAYLFFNEEESKLRAYALGSYVLFLIAGLFSFSRSAILALFIGLLLLIWQNWRKRYQKLRPAAALLVLSIFILSLFAAQYSDLIWARAQTSSRLEHISLSERQTYNERAWQDLKETPFFGLGLGVSPEFDYRQDFARSQAQAVWNYQPAHNYWLLAAVEGGIFFLSALILLWFFVYKKSRERRLVAIFVALFILTLFDHWLFSLPLAVLWLAFFFVLI
ncbi:O-antigen ligase family protein [Patescibacteria group bacterium]|nr:O-antigen ligase family protein [Patescibacteria group bacterium]